MIDVAYRRALRPVLFRAYGGDPERIHERTLAMITEIGEVTPARAAATAFCARHRVPVEMAGIRFPGLVGLAAGMDKNGYAIRSWAALGFGHAELGTVTAHAQPGNDRPRLFRLPASHALINRMGFNNAGAAALADRLATAGVLRGNQAMGIPLGISIGKSKITPLAGGRRRLSHLVAPAHPVRRLPGDQCLQPQYSRPAGRCRMPAPSAN